jgi:hypothetical protein
VLIATIRIERVATQAHLATADLEHHATMPLVHFVHRDFKVYQRSLLSIGKLNMARSRVRPSIIGRVRIDQTCFGRSGGLAPISLPLFHGPRWRVFRRE